MTVTAEHITFSDRSGRQLGARIDSPAGPPRAWAVLAHCFACAAGGDAPSRIAAELTDLGYAVLRLDVTGLGGDGPGGEPANPDHVAGASDVVAAADWLRAERSAPQLLVAHSIAGALAILAAGAVPEVVAVATIGAPASLEQLDAFDADGTIRIGEQRVRLDDDIVASLRADAILAALEGFGGAKLLLHSPVDQVVGIDHAARLYAAARHPKSFIGLDGADHVLGDAADAAYAARMIGAWAGRYLRDESGEADAPASTAQVVVAETTQGKFLNHVVAGPHRFLADEPVAVGGFDAGPSPYDLVAAALGTCTSMTVRMYADRKQWPLDRVTLEVWHEKVHAADAALAADGTPRIDRFTRVLQLDGDLDDEQRQRLLEIAGRCPVHRTLERSSSIETRLAPD